jgi:hypothetical protein
MQIASEDDDEVDRFTAKIITEPTTRGPARLLADVFGRVHSVIGIGMMSGGMEL